MIDGSKFGPFELKMSLQSFFIFFMDFFQKLIIEGLREHSHVTLHL